MLTFFMMYEPIRRPWISIFITFVKNNPMEIFRTKKSLVDYIERNREMGKKIGFAPTMGALHEGHLSLYEIAKDENDLVIASIFVNPTQFNNQEDLIKYPRTVDKDLQLLEKTHHVDGVYVPSVEDIYPNGTESKTYDFGGIDKEMEGAFRPGHFDGVGTVVEELLRQVKPNNAYFGEKDFQQLAIIKKLVEITKLPVRIHGVPIVREKSGLALSSRNQRLTEKQHAEAKLIHETLVKVQDWFGKISLEEIKNRVFEIFDDAPGFRMEYFIIAEEKTLKEAIKIDPKKKYRAFIVVYLGDVRLIDNISLG